MSLTPEKIDAILPQTQCGLCGYGGCMPYAKALVEENAAINLCPPGGVTGLKKIAELMHQDATPFIKEMEQKQKPRLTAVIREAECIGCAKCIKACPVDAILGSGKLMHTILTDQCSGCELCIAPCPVDCIELVVLPEISQEEQQQKADLYRARYTAREARLAREESSTPEIKKSATTQTTAQDKKAFILAALQRAKKVNS